MRLQPIGMMLKLTKKYNLHCSKPELFMDIVGSWS